MDAEEIETINAELEQTAQLKEKIKDQVTELDKRIRKIAGALDKVHSIPAKQVPALVESLRIELRSCQPYTEAIAALIPTNQFWRWKEMWQYTVRSAVFAAALMQFLVNDELLTIAQVADILGIKSEWEGRMELAAEDYLHGIINVINELSRLSVNAVTLGDYEQPIRISKFAKNVFAGYSMLNLKNDALRRRFDSLKYDIKKIEEVVYDVSLRNLGKENKEEIA